MAAVVTRLRTRRRLLFTGIACVLSALLLAMEGGQINALPVWEALHRTDWRAFIEALARE